MEFRVTLPQNYRSGMAIVVQGMEIKLPPGFHAGQTVSLKMKDSGGGAPPRSSAAADGADYRSGFGVPNNPRLSDNLRFIKGVGVATQKNAYAVSDFHPPSGIFFGDYTALESMHDYIQWDPAIAIAVCFHSIQLLSPLLPRARPPSLSHRR